MPASMEPSVSTLGDGNQIITAATTQPASMEPSVSTLGDRSQVSSRCSTASSFNGAERFNARRPVRYSRFVHVRRLASMEPSVSTLGDACSPPSCCGPRAWLQWSRAFQRSETSRKSAGDLPTAVASMEPSVSTLGDGAVWRDMHLSRISFNGAERFNARRLQRSVLRGWRSEAASMEPRRFNARRRHSAVARSAAGWQRLQWSRAFQRSETRTQLRPIVGCRWEASMEPSVSTLGDTRRRAVPRQTPTCFNGAERFNARRRTSSAPGAASRAIRFNGAERFNARRRLRVAVGL